MEKLLKVVGAFLAACSLAAAFQGNLRSFVGTVIGFKVESAEIQVKPDGGEPVLATITPGVVAQKIAPGETDLKKAQTIKVTEIAAGDRVLVTFEPGTSNLRRIVVMAAGDIARRNAADRADWTKRGISGVVASRRDNQIAVRIKTLQGEAVATVTVGEKTSFKRYAPDSVKFADAKPGKLAEIAVGDELRARGQKSEDGLKVTAEEVVFGAFETRVGTISALNAAAREITIKDMASGKPVLVRVAADSQIKRMPDASGLAGALGGGRAAAPSGAAAAPPARPAAPAGAAAPRPAQPAAAAAPARNALAQMSIPQLLEMMPAGKFEDLKAGETVVVSSTRGAKKDEITAITLVAHADMLIQIAEQQAKAITLALGAAGLQGGGAGLQIPGMSQ